MIIIAYCSEDILVGGFGDRLLGIYNIKCLSDFLCADFHIDWQYPSIKEYFNYEKYDAEISYSREILNNIYKEHSYHSKLDVFLNILKTDNLHISLENMIAIPILGINYMLYLYQNNYYKDKLKPYSSILSNYNSIFSDILIPKDNILSHIPTIYNDASNTSSIRIGIQIRCGDQYMDIHNPDIHMVSTENVIYEMIYKVIYDIVEKYIEEYSEIHLFITSDSSITYDYICRIVNKFNMNDKVLLYYDNRKITHIELSSNKTAIDKTYSDMITLSKCDKLYITFDSNMGRLSALINEKITDEVNIIKIPRKNNMNEKGLSSIPLYKMTSKENIDDKLWNTIFSI